MNDYYIVRRYPVGSKPITLYHLDESPDSMLRWDAIDALKRRGMTEEQANSYLDSLEFVPTRGSTTP